MIKHKTNVSLKNYCTIKIGGPAKELYEIDNLQELKNVCFKLIETNTRFKIIGNGSNLIFDDHGFNGTIIVNKTNKLIKRNNSIYATSGCTIGQLLNFCVKHNLTGLENFAGIPATLGGAIVNNMGAFDNEISNHIGHVVCINILTGEIIKLNNKDCNFLYRNSLFKNNEYIILSAKLNLKPDSSENIKQKIYKSIKHKTDSQPLNYPSAGSVFKRNSLIPAKLIDEFGFKGHLLGGVMVSSKHAGFIVNFNNGTCQEFKTLANRIKQAIDCYYNTCLEFEVEFVPY